MNYPLLIGNINLTGSGGGISTPDWWKIATLDGADIIGAWDFGWIGHTSREKALISLDGSSKEFVVNQGTPTLRRGEGIYFGGGGTLTTPVTADVANLSVIIQFKDARENAALNAFFSHFTSQTHFTLQNDFANSVVRWSCGDENATTLEASRTQLDQGVYGVSGPTLYLDGQSVLSIPDTGVTSPYDFSFRLGSILTDSTPNTQNIIATVEKILIVNRLLSDDEQLEIYNNIAGSVIVTHNNSPVTHNMEEVTWS